jgi:hypothetical protein
MLRLWSLRRLVDWNRRDWLIEENSRLTVAATRPLPPARGLKQRRFIDWGKMAVLQLLQTRPLSPVCGLKQKRLINWSCYKCFDSIPPPAPGPKQKRSIINLLMKNGRVTVAVTCPLPQACGLKQKRLIEGKWSCYRCCNFSPPAGLWTETKQIGWLKENGRLTDAAT